VRTRAEERSYLEAKPMVKVRVPTALIWRVEDERERERGPGVAWIGRPLENESMRLPR
jgi:hypothetical protein